MAPPEIVASWRARFAFVALFLTLGVYAGAADSQKNPERIEVAPDHWTFREANSHKRFVPFGVNYTPAWSGWAPDYLSAEKFDHGRIDADFREMEKLGLNVCKVVLTGNRVLPDPQTSAGVVLDSGCLDRFEQVVRIADADHIRLITTVEIGWHGYPDWFTREGGWFGQGNRRIVADFWRKFAAKYRGDGRIFAYSFCVETAMRDWDTTAAIAAWREHAKSKYATIERANETWGTTFTEWNRVPAPGFDGKNTPDWRSHAEGTDENENKTNNPFLYDFMLFREQAAFQWMYNLSLAVKSVDPHALCSMGFIQWGILQRSFGKTHEGPLFAIEYNPHELAQAFDFVGIHFYPTVPNDWSFPRQLKCLEIWARWAYRQRPVILEEFNMYGADNAAWCETAIRKSRGYLSGWLTWTFQNVPNSDDITRQCGLLDAQGNLTTWGRKCKEMAPEVKTWKLKRHPPERIVRADKKFLFTSSHYRDFLDQLLTTDTCSLDYDMAPNPDIERMLRTRTAE